MLRTPERVRAEQLRLEGHEVPVAGREVDEALEVQVVLDAERDGQRAHPDPGHRRVADVDRSTPAAWSSRAASIVRSMRIERGGSISTEIDEPAVRERPRQPGRAVARSGPVVGVADGRRSRRAGPARSGRPRPRAASARRDRSGVERRAHRGDVLRRRPAAATDDPRRPASTNAGTISPR